MKCMCHDLTTRCFDGSRGSFQWFQSSDLNGILHALFYDWLSGHL